MDDYDLKRIRGLKRLIFDGVERGVDFVEKHHRHAAAKPFAVLELMRPIATPTKVVRIIHDGVLSLTYGSIRSVNRAIKVVDDWLEDSPASTGESEIKKT